MYLTSEASEAGSITARTLTCWQTQGKGLVNGITGTLRNVKDLAGQAIDDFEKAMPGERKRKCQVHVDVCCFALCLVLWCQLRQICLPPRAAAGQRSAISNVPYTLWLGRCPRVKLLISCCLLTSIIATRMLAAGE